MSERVGLNLKKPEVNRDNSYSLMRRNNHPRSVNPSVDRILFLQRTAGNQAVQKLLRSGALQAKLRIGQPGDVYEQEADRVADAVMRMPELGVQRQVEPEEEEEEILQTKPLVDQITPVVQRQLEEEEEMLQAKSTENATPEVSNDLESQINAIKGGGQPMAESERAYFEPRFGTDFSQVRLHTDTQADESARAMNARAFTVGQHIVFRKGQYVPGTVSGQHLLAHELVHTVQQTGSLQGMFVQLMATCPPTLDASDPVPSGWKSYNGNPCWFHCCYRGILEDRIPTPDDPQNECFYDENSALVDEHHENSGCRGTPNQFNSASDWWRHTFEDEGGTWSRGWGAFWSSRWYDLNQHFEREERRRMECREICNQQPWYLRGFCLEGCSPHMR